MTSGYDQPARSVSTPLTHPNPGLLRGRHMVTLLAVGASGGWCPGRRRACGRGVRRRRAACGGARQA